MANDKKRVKVYELRENDWFDRGTGFCTGQVINVSTFSRLVDAKAHIFTTELADIVAGGATNIRRIRRLARQAATRD
jgi:hypothetical protein